MKRLLSLLLAILILVLAAGCGQEKTFKTQEGTVNVQEDKVEVNSEDGKSQITVGEAGEVSLPDGYPADVVPVITGGKISASTKNEDESKKTAYSVMIMTDQDIKDVVTFYKDALKDLKDLQVMETPELTTISGQNKDYTIYVLVGIDNSEDKPRTGVNITLTPM